MASVSVSGCAGCSSNARHALAQSSGGRLGFVSASAALRTLAMRSSGSLGAEVAKAVTNARQGTA